jgi:hypothetical protein
MFSKLLMARWNYGDDEYNCFTVSIQFIYAVY